MQVAAFLGDQKTCEYAAQRLAVILRRAYRGDLRNTLCTDQPEAIIFPHDVPETPGPSLQRVLLTLPTLDPLSIRCLLPHLALPEALMLPSPFPEMALEHYVKATNGILDLSPPRIPAYTPRTLLRMCELISLVLPTTAPVLALHVPAPCLHSPDILTALFPVLTSLTRLCITHGKVTYTDLSSPKSLQCSVLAAVLARLSTSSLRHLSVSGPLKCTPGEPDICRLLGTFTALTHLRMPVPQQKPQTFLADLFSLPSLSSLHTLAITHTQSGTRTARQPTPMPSLQRLHACGTAAATAEIMDTCLRWVRDTRAPGDIEEVKLLTRAAPSSEPRPDVVAFMESLQTLQPACRSFFSTLMPPDATLTCMDGLGVEMGNALPVDAATPPRLRTVWQLLPPGGGSLLTRFPCDTPLPIAAPALRELTFAMPAAVDDVAPVGDRVLAAALTGLPCCAALCVLYAEDVPPHSAVCWSAAEERRSEADSACGWVTDRRDGVSHPLCALEMLDQANAGDVGDGPRAVRGAGVRDAGVHAAEGDADGAALRTLRVSRDMFMPRIQARSRPARRVCAAGAVTMHA